MVSKTLSGFKSILEPLLSSFRSVSFINTDFLGSVSCNSSSLNSQKSRVLLSSRCLIFKVLALSISFSLSASLSSAWLSYHIRFRLSSTFLSFFEPVRLPSGTVTRSALNSLSSAQILYHEHSRLSSTFFKDFRPSTSLASAAFQSSLFFVPSLECSGIISCLFPNVNAFLRYFVFFFLIPLSSVGGYFFPLIIPLFFMQFFPWIGFYPVRAK